MLDCYCDYDAPQVYSAKAVKARKQYRCEECSSPISVGEAHEYAFGVMDGWTYQPRTCLSCVHIRNWMKTNVPCFCWAHGNLFGDCEDTIQAAYEQAAEEVRGLWFGYQRLRIKARRERQMARAA